MRKGAELNEARGGNIALIGFMGAGKTAVGRALAARLGMEFIDLDERIADEAGMSVAEIFSLEGEDGFRIREAAALRGALSGEGAVIACGGGVVNRDDNVSLLRERAVVFYLEVALETALRRVSRDGTARPLLETEDPGGAARALMRERSSRYLAAAHEVVRADAASPEELAEEIAGRWNRSR